MKKFFSFNIWYTLALTGSHLTLDSIVIEKGILLGDKSGPKKLAFFSQLQ